MELMTGAVVIAGLKYVGPAAGEVVKNFLNRVLSPAGDAIGEVAAHPIVEWQRRRYERGASILNDAAQLVKEQQAEPTAVPGRILIPLLEKASLEEDGDLRARWVRLLASAATTPSKVLPAYVAILSELAPEEVKLLARLYRRTRRHGTRGVYYSEVTARWAGRTCDVHLETMPVLVGNLLRLGIIRHPIQVSGRDIQHIVDSRDLDIEGGYDRTPADDFDAEYDNERFSLTNLGAAFVEACSYPEQPPLDDWPEDPRDPIQEPRRLRLP